MNSKTATPKQRPYDVATWQQVHALLRRPIDARDGNQIAALIMPDARSYSANFASTWQWTYGNIESECLSAIQGIIESIIKGKGPDAFTSVGETHNFFITSMHNICRNVVRTASRVHRLTEHLDVTVGDDEKTTWVDFLSAPTQCAVDDRRAVMLQEVLDEVAKKHLPPQQYEIFRLTCEVDAQENKLSYDEMATRMGMTLKGFKSCIYRMRQNLLKHVNTATMNAWLRGEETDDMLPQLQSAGVNGMGR